MNNDYWNAYTTNVQPHQYVDWVPASTQSQQSQYIHTPYHTNPTNQYSTSATNYSTGTYASGNQTSGYTGYANNGVSNMTNAGGYSNAGVSSGYSAGTTYQSGAVQNVAAAPAYSSLKSKKRKYATNSQEIEVFFGRDETYPADLNALFQPLFCELCGVHLNSVKSSQIHYESKSHDKHITTWLAHNFTEKGLDPPNIKRYVKEVKIGPTAFFCEICALPLTSLAHAKQHYSGRRHNLVANRISNPSTTNGYYDDQGKWVRPPQKKATKSAKKKNANLLKTTSNTIITTKTPINSTVAADEAFTSDISNTEVSGIKTDADSTNGTTTKVDETSTFCMTCNISVTSAPQMEMHRQGSKHLKKLKEFGLPTAPKVECGETTILALNANGVPTDVSVYRTPSGCYYCKTCNINVTDESSMRTHLVGKKHVKIAQNSELETDQPKSTKQFY